MMKHLIPAAMLLLAGCGGVNKFERDGRGSTYRAMPVAPMASGPISRACMASDRKARSAALCGCVQWVANETLSGSDQRRAVKFYREPQLAQDIRQSKRASDNVFWDAYTAYGTRAQQICG